MCSDCEHDTVDHPRATLSQRYHHCVHHHRHSVTPGESRTGVMRSVRQHTAACHSVTQVTAAAATVSSVSTSDSQ